MGLNLGCLAGAYCATQHESTGPSPNLLMLGQEIRLPSDIIQGGLLLTMWEASCGIHMASAGKNEPCTYNC